jgi:hypothetical protein
VWRGLAEELGMKISNLSCAAFIEYLEKRGINPGTGKEANE